MVINEEDAFHNREVEGWDADTTSGIIRNISKKFPEPWGIWVSTSLRLNCHSLHDQLLLHLPGLRETFPCHEPHQGQGVPLLGDP
jgi:hypothetical protein